MLGTDLRRRREGTAWLIASGIRNALVKNPAGKFAFEYVAAALKEEQSERSVDRKPETLGLGPSSSPIRPRLKPTTWREEQILGIDPLCSSKNLLE